MAVYPQNFIEPIAVFSKDWESVMKVGGHYTETDSGTSYGIKNA
jgi:hypothetical protein